MRGTTTPVYTDWTTRNLIVSTTRPQAAQSLVANEEITLDHGIMLRNDSEMTAVARLMSEPESGRSISGRTLPDLLRSDAAQTEPFALNPTRALDEPGLSVLALDDAEDYASVSPETPLVLTVPVSLAEGEYLLPYGFDGEFYLPLGRVTSRQEGTEITLEQIAGAGTDQRPGQLDPHLLPEGDGGHHRSRVALSAAGYGR